MRHPEALRKHPPEGWGQGAELTASVATPTLWGLATPEWEGRLGQGRQRGRAGQYAVGWPGLSQGPDSVPHAGLQELPGWRPQSTPQPQHRAELPCSGRGRRRGQGTQPDPHHRAEGPEQRRRSGPWPQLPRPHSESSEPAPPSALCACSPAAPRALSLRPPPGRLSDRTTPTSPPAPPPASV